MASGSSCAAVPRATLSFQCGGACSPHLPCMAAADLKATSATGFGSSCRCFVIDKATPTTYGAFNFLVPFDAATTAALGRTKPPSFEAAAATSTNDLQLYAWANNSQLTRIEPLDLFKTTTIVSLRGGSSFTATTKGFMATVELDPKFLSSQPQVTWLLLANLNLTASMADIAANLPAELQSLDIGNTGITEFPVALMKLKMLRTLRLGLNNIEQVTAAHSMPDITNLYLNANKVKRFDALFPKLTALDLAFNQLESVPASIRKHTLLTTLHLGGNVMQEFNASSVPSSVSTISLFGNTLKTYDAYLPALEYLDLTLTNLAEFPAVVFSHAKLQTLYVRVVVSFIYFQLTVCIRGGKNMTTIMSTPRIIALAPNAGVPTPTPVAVGTPAPSAAAALEGESSGVLIPLIIGITVLAIVVTSLAFLLLERRRRRPAKAGDKSATGTEESGDTDSSSRSRSDAASLWDDDMVSVGDAVPTLSVTCPAEIAAIAASCFELDPAKRPTALEIAYKLRTLKKQGLVVSA
ncbi:hypothetical protein PybrP1_009165 [[Pythium] brassicae (nom. inval.)]|nr:hypothetical protein PybrP1_009165 [[Pythium] brassicae (nom. inval.)]